MGATAVSSKSSSAGGTGGAGAVAGTTTSDSFDSNASSYTARRLAPPLPRQPQRDTVMPLASSAAAAAPQQLAQQQRQQQRQQSMPTAATRQGRSLDLAVGGPTAAAAGGFTAPRLASLPAGGLFNTSDAADEDESGKQCCLADLKIKETSEVHHVESQQHCTKSVLKLLCLKTCAFDNPCVKKMC